MKTNKRFRTTSILHYFNFLVISITICFIIRKLWVKYYTRSQFKFFKRCNMLGLFISVLAIPSSTHRLIQTQDNWADAFIRKTTKKNFIFVSNQNITNFRVYNPSQNIMKYYRLREYDFWAVNDDKISKRFGCFEYCLLNLECRWVLSTCDDVYIELSNLESFIDELESKYRPLHESVIKAHCLANCGEVNYLQGGSGYIFSRYAAQLLYIARSQWLFSDTISDYLTPYWIKYLKIEFAETSNSRFVGHHFNEEELEIVRTHKYHLLSKCPQHYFYVPCSSSKYQINQIAIFHKFGKIGYPKYEGFLEAPSNILFYMNQCEQIICIDQEKP